MTTVSILVAVKDSSRFLRRCLESIAAQTILPQCETVIIDGGTDGKDAALVRAFEDRLGQVRWLEAEGAGVYSAWNQGIRRSTGEFIMNLNSDDTLEPQAVELLRDRLLQRPGCALAYGISSVEELRPEGIIRTERRVPFFPPQGLGILPSLKQQFGPHPMWRRMLHDQVGWFDESLQIVGDLDFWIRLSPDHPVVRLDQKVGTYLFRPDSVSQRDAVLKRQEILTVLARYL